MTVAVVLGIGLAGGVGAVARFLMDGVLASRVRGEFPYGTLVVNLTGAFALGVVVGAAVDKDAYRIVATGLIGAFTTFSTWALESQRLGEGGELRLGVLNFIGSLILGTLAAWAGRHLGASL